MPQASSNTHRVVVDGEHRSSRVKPGRVTARAGDTVRIHSSQFPAVVWFPVPGIFEESPGPTRIAAGSTSDSFTVADKPGSYPFAVACLRREGDKELPEFAEGGSMPRIIIFE